MSAALFYVPDAYVAQGTGVMGRNVAGESFLRGFAAHSRAAEFTALVYTQQHAQEFTAAIRSAGRQEPVQIVTAKVLARLANAGALHYPSPQLGGAALQRAAFGHGAWSLTGITHTVSSAAAMDSITSLLTAPVQPWDALVCTSTAVRAVVMQLLESQENYLRERLGATRIVLPQLPVIPLGIHSADFAFSGDDRNAARQALGIDADTLAVLFLGRLSFHAKAHPLALYQALAKAARASGKKTVLIECGRHASEQIRAAFEQAASLVCPALRVIRLDSESADKRRTAWAAADVFSSLSDNIQESFGLTPLEAMAAGLPVVVSDWDGYRDTVRDGVDGFRIPTLMPAPGLGGDLALRHALDIDSYDRYCGYTSALVAVDIDAAAQAFIKLFENPALRHNMGAAGRERAASVYDWAAIIPQYERLWSELAERRKAAANDATAKQAWAARPDPFRLFAAYPSSTLAPATRFHLNDADLAAARARLGTYRGLTMVDFATPILPADVELDAILAAVAAGPKTARELAQAFVGQRRAAVLRGLAWLVKLGILAVQKD